MMRKRLRKSKSCPQSFGSRTDVGCVREQNEDSLIVQPPLYMVADGMGGHAAGEIASEIAVTTVSNNMPDHLDPELLGKAVERANRAIIDAAEQGYGREGMGTTCTAAMLEGTQLILAQVGDSRAYLLHEGRLQQLTRDHSLMANMIEAGQITPEEAKIHPQRSVITRALGSDPQTKPDLYEISVSEGDRLLLCSDGLSGMISDALITNVMNRTSNPQLCATQLINEAIGAGGHDNITAIVVDVEGLRPLKEKKEQRKSRRHIALVLILLVLIFASAGYGANYYFNNSAYLINENGKVALYRGVPGEFLGFSSSEEIKVTDINVEDLPVSAANRIETGLKFTSVEEAERQLDEYEHNIAERNNSQSVFPKESLVTEKDKQSVQATEPPTDAKEDN